MKIFSRNILNFKAISLFVLLLISNQLFAQLPFEFKHIQEKDGLSHNFVNCFLRDKDGFLWVGTYDGLDCFDGKHFKNFSKQKESAKGLINNIVHDITEDKNGDIWYATEGGIGCYHKKTNQFENYEKVLDFPLFHVLNIRCDKKGDVWFSAVTGLFRYQSKTKTFEVFLHNPSMSKSILKTYISKNGFQEDKLKNALWISTDNGLMYLNTDTKEFFHEINNPKQLEIFKNQKTTAITSYSSKEFIFGNAQNQLIIYNSESEKIIKQIPLKHPKVIQSRTILTIFVDNRQNIWVSTRDNILFFIEAKTWNIIPFEHQENDINTVAGSHFSAVYQDENQTMLFGTSNGISFTNPDGALFKIHSINNKLLPNDSYISFYENENNWWLGTQGSGLFNFEPKTTAVSKVKLNKNSIWEITKLNDKYYMSAGGVGFWEYDAEKNQTNQINLPPNYQQINPLVTALEVQNDSLVWLSGVNKYILRYNIRSKKMTFFDLFQNQNAEAVNLLDLRVKVDSKNNVWVITGSSGIYQFSETKQQFFATNFKEDFQFETIFSQISVDRNNIFWIPNRNKGLYRFDSKTNSCKFLNKADGLPSDFCGATIVDNLGNIWIAASHKVSVYNPNSGTFQNFTVPSNGLQPSGFSKFYKLKNGNILYLYNGAVIEFFTNRIHKNILTAKPLIHNIALPNSEGFSLIGKDQISLGVNQNNFTVTYSYLPLSLNDAYSYAYRLEGFEKTWHKVDRSGAATYSNLPGGDYVFKVIATNGSSTSTESILKIHIDTVFYKTWWFITLLMASILALVYVFYRYRLNQSANLHRMQLLTTSLQKEKSEIQYQNLINHLNPHFLFNSLTSLNSLIITEPKTASKFLQKLSAIYRYILQNKDKEIVTLEHEINFVNNYIDLQKSRFDVGLQINIEIDEDFLMSGIVPVTLQNLFENAIKHNIIEDENPLKIDVFVDGDYLVVKNNLQRKKFVDTSNKQGLESLKKLYSYLTTKPFEIVETETHFSIRIPLL